MDYNQYFVADGRSFDSYFFKGTGGDQNFGIYMSDGMDVGQVYQRANGTGNTGWFYGNNDLGRLMLSHEATARAYPVSPVTLVSVYSFIGGVETYVTLQWRVEGGSGEFSLVELIPVSDGFISSEWLNSASVTNLRVSTQKVIGRTWYDKSRRVLCANLSRASGNRSSGPVESRYSFSPGIDSDTQRNYWINHAVSYLKCMFTDSLTGVTYTSEPIALLNYRKRDEWPKEFNYLRGTCNWDCSCDGHYCDCDSHCFDCSDHE